MMVVRANHISACKKPSSGWRCSSVSILGMARTTGSHLWTASGLLTRMPADEEDDEVAVQVCREALRVDHRLP